MRSDRLRQVRRQLGYTQESLAEQLHLSHRQIWRYENGETDPSGDIVASIAQMLNVSSDFLLGLSDNPAPCADEENLTTTEIEVIRAWRDGKKLRALKIIIDS